MSSHPPARPRRPPSVPAATSTTANHESLRHQSSPQTAQPLLLNDVSSRTPNVTSSGENSESTTTVDQRISHRATEPLEDEQPRKCWICFSDETEDEPMSSEWRSPCPCALTAHESCLLDWVADLQGPGASKGVQKILCPQCKSEIRLERPKSLLVDTIRTLDLVAGYARLPAILFTFAGCLWTGCTVFGINTIYMIFGEDGTDLLPSGTNIFTVYRVINPFLAAPDEWSWRLSLGLPLIPGVLILSRTRFGDAILPSLPVMFLIANETDFIGMEWPPSALLTLSALPYLRSIYNRLYERAFGEQERRWIKEARPRGREIDHQAPPPAGNAQGAGDEDIMERAEDGDVLVELDVAVDIDFWDENENIVDPPAAPPQIQDPQRAVGDDVQQPAPQQPQAIEHNLLMSASRVTDTVIGALFFPTISAIMGEILQRILPGSWTNPSMAKRRGLLQAKWGRSIVGGCLFVVLKDAIILYSRYKRAQQHRETRIVDYKGSKGRKRSIR